jgi:type IV/VI secretion system ImpK/VasF family protein
MFRRRTKEALAEVTREAMKRNYAAEHTIETDFAVVAFLDEVILTSKDPARDAWVQRPLQEELFNISTAGELFFARIERLLQRADTPELADMLEVYYLCILLGFEGQYATTNKTEVHILAGRLRQRIERIRGPIRASAVRHPARRPHRHGCSGRVGGQIEAGRHGRGWCRDFYLSGSMASPVLQGLHLA